MELYKKYYKKLKKDYLTFKSMKKKHNKRPEFSDLLML